MYVAPTISVVIPCYNAGPYLVECLESVLRQTLPANEIIVIDDGSTDNSGAIASSYANVRVIRQPNGGESVARNVGLDQACGEWIALLDADDVWEKNKLESQVALVDDEAVCVYSDFITLPMNGQDAEVICRPRRDQSPNFRVEMFHGTVQPSTALVRTSTARKIRFNAHIQYSEDTIFFAQLREYGPFRKVAMPLARWRLSATSQTKHPAYFLRSFRAKYDWFMSRESLYTMEERAEIRGRLQSSLVSAHNFAYWQRRFDVVKQCRREFETLYGSRPASLRQTIWPRWTYRIKDRIDCVLNRSRDAG